MYLRNSPHDGDRARVIAENTPLKVTGELVEGDGQQWYPVKAPDDTEGYVPKPYTSDKDPNAPPAPVVQDQTR